MQEKTETMRSLTEIAKKKIIFLSNFFKLPKKFEHRFPYRELSLYHKSMFKNNKAKKKVFS